MSGTDGAAPDDPDGRPAGVTGGGATGVAFVMELGSALHRFGTPAHRLEGAMGAVAGQLSLEAQVLSTPTSVMAGFGPLEQQRTILVRVDPGEVNLEKLSDLDRVADEVGRGQLDVTEGVQRVRGISARPGRYPAPLRVLAFGLLSASVAVFFNGGWYEVATAGPIGLVIGLLSLGFRRNPAGGRVFELVAAFAAAAMAHGAVALGFPVSLRIAILAGLIVLLPGLTLTVAMTELATRNLVSGTARLTAAAMTFLEITFGVALAEILMLRLFDSTGPVAAAAAAPLPTWTEPIALAVFVPAIMVEFAAHPRHLAVIAMACAASFYSARLGTDLLTPELGAAIGGFVLGAGSNAYARLTNRTAMVALVPGLLLLVPGSMGLRSLSSMLERDVVSGIDTAFAMMLVAVSLVAGLLMANASVSPRRNL